MKGVGCLLSSAIIAVALFAQPAAAPAADETVIFRGIQTQDTIIDALKPGLRAARPTHTPRDDDGGGGSLSLMVLFAFNSAELTPTARAQLDAIGAAMQSDSLRPFTFLVEGHTDAAGDEAYNLVLSQRRADAVRTYLVGVHGIDPNRLQAVGRGKTNLFRPEEPLAEENRRVRFINMGA